LYLMRRANIRSSTESKIYSRTSVVTNVARCHIDHGLAVASPWIDALWELEINRSERKKQLILKCKKILPHSKQALVRSRMGYLTVVAFSLLKSACGKQVDGANSLFLL
jgi:hypothetical protein